MRIKLRNLLNLTEQAPSAPDPLSPTPAPIQPGMNAGGQDDQQTPPATPDTSPEPEDPGEYDFTKDFRAFEDKKNKAEAAKPIRSAGAATRPVYTPAKDKR